MEQELIRKSELAKFCRVSVNTIYNWTKEGKLPKPIIESNNLCLYDFNECKAYLGIRSTIASA